MPQYPEYKIIQAKGLDSLEEITKKYIADGWQPLGEIGYILVTNLFYHEMMRFPKPFENDNLSQTLEDNFKEKMSKMDTYVKDLLDVNGIKLICQEGKLFTLYDSKVFEGISPNQVVQFIKGSKHCPIDLDEKKVINAIEGII